MRVARFSLGRSAACLRYGIDDTKCKMGTVDMKLDMDYTVILISRY